MAVGAQRYSNLLTALLPRGLAWVDAANNKLGDLLLALADELARVDARESDLLDEADPRTTYEMLSDWEAAFGLPDPCVTVSLTLEQRLDSLYAKVTNEGGQSRQFFIDLAASLGYDITITEFDPFTVESTVDELLYNDDWQFAWQVNAPDETVNYFTVNSDVDTALANWGNQRLECGISRLKPAHTTIIFAYGG